MRIVFSLRFQQKILSNIVTASKYFESLDHIDFMVVWCSGEHHRF